MKWQKGYPVHVCVCVCVCVYLCLRSKNHVRSITSSCMVSMQTLWAQMIIIMTRRCVAFRTNAIILKVNVKGCVQAQLASARVRSITLCCMAGFQNCYAQIIIMTLRCVACKIFVISLNVKDTQCMRALL